MILEESEVVDIEEFGDFGDTKEGLWGDEDTCFENLKVFFIIWSEELMNSNILCFSSVFIFQNSIPSYFRRIYFSWKGT